MSERSYKAWVGVLLAGAVLVGCQSPPAAPAGQLKGAVIAAPAALTVRVLLPGEVIRHVAAIGEEVTRLRVSVTAVDGRVWEREWLRPAFGSFQAELTFTGLPAGGVRLAVVGYDHQDRVLGRGAVESSVASGTGQTVELPLHLNEESRLGAIVTAAGPAVPLPPSTVAAKNEALDGTLVVAEDGAIWLKQLDKLHRLGQDAGIVSTVSGLSLTFGQVAAPAVAADGHIWEYSGTLREFGPDGTLLKTYPDLHGTPVLAKDGSLWLLGAIPDSSLTQTVQKVTRDGIPLHSTLFRSPMAHISGQVDPVSGNLWVTFMTGDTTLRQMAEDGRVLSASRPLQSIFDLEVTPSFDADAGFAPDGTGHAWLASYWSGKVSKIGPNGIVGEYAVCPHPNAVAVDGKGNVWVGGGMDLESNLVKLAPDGSLIGALSLAGGVMQLKTDGQGDVWVVTHAPSAVYRLTP